MNESTRFASEEGSDERGRLLAHSTHKTNKFTSRAACKCRCCVLEVVSLCRMFSGAAKIRPRCCGVESVERKAHTECGDFDDALLAAAAADDSRAPRVCGYY